MMLKVCYKPSFVRQFKKLPVGLQEEAIAKIGFFKDPKNHTLLGVHKLHGKLKKYSGFSVDFQNRIVFDYLSANEVVLLSIGDHDIYK
ncbi:MAG: type II toxin-antitoxin system mRNA interferase toxin, RelE/StbE family [bacterium]|nr:type II toxin-antitoxin system mRNA interferase toxin, RelE/StbE family [bacterium]